VGCCGNEAAGLGSAFTHEHTQNSFDQPTGVVAVAGGGIGGAGGGDSFEFERRGGEGGDSHADDSVVGRSGAGDRAGDVADV
jgi:hypothetical protein